MSNERRKYFFVCENFESGSFKTLRRKRCRICGPPLLHYLHSRKRALPETSRPLFNGSMFGVAVCFTGFASRGNTVNHLADLVHFMGGSVRRDFSGKITHLVANLAQGQKYKVKFDKLRFCYIGFVCFHTCYSLYLLYYILSIFY